MISWPEDFRGQCPSLVHFAVTYQMLHWSDTAFPHQTIWNVHSKDIWNTFQIAYFYVVLLLFFKSPKIVWQSQVISGTRCEICVYNFFSRLFFIYLTLPYLLLHKCSFTYCMYNLDSRSQFWSQPFVSISMEGSPHLRKINMYNLLTHETYSQISVSV